MVSTPYTYSDFILKGLDLIALEAELKKRWPYRDLWFRKQNDIWDDYSNFIYHIQSF